MVVSLFLTHILLEVASQIIFLPSPFQFHSSSISKELHWWRRSKAYKLHMELHHQIYHWIPSRYQIHCKWTCQCHHSHGWCQSRHSHSRWYWIEIQRSNLKREDTNQDSSSVVTTHGAYKGKMSYKNYGSTSSHTTTPLAARKLFVIIVTKLGT